MNYSILLFPFIYGFIQELFMNLISSEISIRMQYKRQISLQLAVHGVMFRLVNDPPITFRLNKNE